MRTFIAKIQTVQQSPVTLLQLKDDLHEALKLLNRPHGRQADEHVGHLPEFATQSLLRRFLREEAFHDIWPDFTELPTKEQPSLRFKPMIPGEKITIRSRQFEMIPVNHTVPGTGYCVQDHKGTVAFSGDTTTNDTLWDVLNQYSDLDLLFIETAFSNNDIEISKLSKHYCPITLGEDILKLKHSPDVWLTHFKPGEEELIYHECVEAMPDFTVHYLRGGEIFKL